MQLRRFFTAIRTAESAYYHFQQRINRAKNLNIIAILHLQSADIGFAPSQDSCLS